MHVLAMEGTMAVAERASQPERVQSQPLPAFESRSPVARLAALHAEAQDTARLANLLGRSIHAAVALLAMGLAALAVTGVLTAESLAWLGFVLVGAGAIALAWRRAIKQPFERAALKSFSQDLDAIMAFAGTAWGAGAFLLLPAAADIATIALFAAGAGALIALLLREHESSLHFLAPVTALASFACVLRPLPAGALAAAMVLIACAAVAVAILAAARWTERAHAPAELPLLPLA
jgi:hypothetical protein